MSTKNTEVPQAIYQIKVTLLGSRPPIWRRLLVPAELTLARLHDVLQAAMGWQDGHLHEFRIARQRGRINERKARLADVLGQAGAKAEYIYDFGDSWTHAVVVEKILAPEAGLIYPLCTDGKLHGPPEDCGGIPGFYNLLEAIHDPEHDEHQDMLEWIGGSFDPESFSLSAVNQRLQHKFHPARKIAAKRVPPKK